MDKTLEKYLETVDRRLRPLPVSERIDIVKEIKGSILEMQNDGLSTEEIVNRLGSPDELARAYLGNLISKDGRFSMNRFLSVFAFYSLTGFSGMFVIPILAVLAPVLMLSGAVSPIAGIIKLLGSILNINVPFVIFQFGSFTLSPFVGFLYSVIMGAVLFLLGRGSWKLLLRYIRTVSRKKKELSI